MSQTLKIIQICKILKIFNKAQAISAKHLEVNSKVKLYNLVICMVNLVLISTNLSENQPLPAHSSLFQNRPYYFSPFQPIPAHSSLFQHILAYSILVKPIPTFVILFQPISAYSSIFHPIPVCYSHLLRI